MSQDSPSRYPTPKKLYEISTAAAGIVEVVAKEFHVPGASALDNPGQIFLGKLDPNDPKFQAKLIVAVCKKLKPARERLTTALGGITHGNVLDGLTDGEAEVLREAIPDAFPADSRPNPNSIVGWPAGVSSAVGIL